MTRTMQKPRRYRRRRAAILIGVLIAVTVVALLIGSVMRTVVMHHRRARTFDRRLQSMWLADSGLQRALARLSVDAEYKGERWELTGESIGRRWPAVVVIQVQPITDDSAVRAIHVESHFPSSPEHRILYRINTSIPVSQKGESE